MKDDTNKRIYKCEAFRLNGNLVALLVEDIYNPLIEPIAGVESFFQSIQHHHFSLWLLVIDYTTLELVCKEKVKDLLCAEDIMCLSMITLYLPSSLRTVRPS